MRGGRNNLLAGSLVVVSIMLSIFIVVLLGGFLEVIGKRDYRVEFAVSDGVGGLEAGSRVLLGGRPVGTVKGLEFKLDDQGYATSVEVDISVDRKIRFRQGATALLLSPLLGGSGQINFRGVGTGPELTQDDIIPGTIAPPSLLADAGYGSEQKAQVQKIIKNVADASDKMNVFLDDARTVVADVRTKWPEWQTRVDSTLKNVDETAARGPALAQSAEDRLAQLREVLDTTKAYLDENRVDVRQTIVNAREISEKANKFTDRLNAELAEKTSLFLDDARVAFEKAGQAVDKIAMLRDEQLPNIRRMMANFRLASDQLASTLAEVRRSPWRLLYRPENRELNFELLYDSARAYAAAVEDLRSTSETIESLRAGGVADGAARIDGLLADLQGAFERYKDAESEFLRQMQIHATDK